MLPVISRSPAHVRASAEWTLVTESGSAVASFDSMVSVQVTSGGQVLTNPIENGSFRAYNKLAVPLRIAVCLAKGGASDEHALTLTTLEAVKKGTELLSLVTPTALYANLTLEEYRYAWEDSTTLTVDLTLTEVREQQSGQDVLYTLASCVNPSSAAVVELGRLRTRPFVVAAL